MQKLLFRLLFLLPRNLISFWTGRLVHIELPNPLGNWSKSWFARRYKIDLNEAEYPIEQYKSIGDLFTRRLKKGLRPVDFEAPVVHPSDSVVNNCGRLENGYMIQAKGRKYSSRSLVVDGDLNEKIHDGWFATYYLCPTDYHRVHSPLKGLIKKAIYVPGTLWPVNDASVNGIDSLYAVNERIVVEIETDLGTAAVVLVGAVNVGKMTLSFDEEIVTNQFQEKSVKEKVYSPPIPIEKGQELGIFHMGSTVVVAYGGRIVSKDFDGSKIYGKPVQVGQGLAQVRS